jgi:hypothetical protein
MLCSSDACVVVKVKNCTVNEERVLKREAPRPFKNRDENTLLPTAASARDVPGNRES